MSVPDNSVNIVYFHYVSAIMCKIYHSGLPTYISSHFAVIHGDEIIQIIGLVNYSHISSNDTNYFEI